MNSGAGKRWSFFSAVPVGLMACLLALACPVFTAAQEESAATKQAKPEKLFSTTETLAVTLNLPWRDIVKDKENQQAYPATIEFTDSLGQTQTLPLTVERRGLTRQTVCKYPPIKLRFEKKTVKGTAFRGETSLKMVTHCDKGDRWEQYYIKEMLAYLMYNLITERSFRVQPLTISYVDSERGKAEDPRFAFLIEDIDDVAKRNDLEKLDIDEINPNQLESLDASRFALFQYMIANVDWSALSGPDPNKCCHNAKLIGLTPDRDVYAIPYDFDSSGLVDAHYAAPNEVLPITRVTQRLYRGFCMHNRTLDTARQEFLAQEQAIYQLVEQESRLSTRTSKSALKYLRVFFDTLRDPGKFQSRIIEKCRK